MLQQFFVTFGGASDQFIDRAPRRFRGESQLSGDFLSPRWTTVVGHRGLAHLVSVAASKTTTTTEQCCFSMVILSARPRLVVMMPDRNVDGASPARRLWERRERMSVAAALAEAIHHSLPKGELSATHSPHGVQEEWPLLPAPEAP